MAILSEAVGDGSKNQADDVKTVQLLLNLNIGRLTPMAADGVRRRERDGASPARNLQGSIRFDF